MRNLKLTILLLLGSFGPMAYAGGFEGEIGYMHIDPDFEGVTLGGAYGIVGYSWEGSGSYKGTAEFMAAYGFKGDDTDVLGINVDVDLDSILGIGYRGTMEINPDLSWYYRIAYARVDVSASAMGVSASADESDFGFGLGLTYRRFTVGFMKFTGDLDGGNALLVGYRF